MDDQTINGSEKIPFQSPSLRISDAPKSQSYKANFFDGVYIRSNSLISSNAETNSASNSNSQWDRDSVFMHPNHPQQTRIIAAQNRRHPASQGNSDPSPCGKSRCNKLLISDKRSLGTIFYSESAPNDVHDKRTDLFNQLHDANRISCLRGSDTELYIKNKRLYFNSFSSNTGDGLSEDNANQIPSRQSLDYAVSPFGSSESSSVTLRLPPSESQLSLPEPPDGGWGWVVVVAAFFVHLITDGVSVSFGIFLEDLMADFDEKMSTTSWVGSFAYGIPMLSAPISTVLINNFGCRFVCILGGIISALGCVAGYFVQSILGLIFTFGVLSGIGSGFSLTAALIIVSVYFDDKRATATGLSIAGMGMGAFLFAPLVDLLINLYTWRGTMLILAGCFLHLVVCGALMRPVETSTERRHRTRLAWLEHFARESGFPPLNDCHEYKSQDTSGRIKLLRDRLLAPRSLKPALSHCSSFPEELDLPCILNPAHCLACESKTLTHQPLTTEPHILSPSLEPYASVASGRESPNQDTVEETLLPNIPEGIPTSQTCRDASPESDSILHFANACFVSDIGANSDVYRPNFQKPHLVPIPEDEVLSSFTNLSPEYQNKFAYSMDLRRDDLSKHVYSVRDSTKKFAYIDNLFRTRRNLSIIHDNETPCSSRGLGRRLFTIASYRNRGYSPMMSKSYESNCQNIRQNFFKGTNFHHHQAFLNHGMNTSSNMHENEDFPNLSNEKLYRSLSLDELAKKENSICSPGVPPNSLSKLRILSDLNLNALPFDSMQASRCHSDPELYLVLTLQSHAPADQVLPDNPEVSGCHVRPSVDSPIHTCNKVSLLQINEQLEAKFQWPFCFQMGCPPDPEPDATRSIDGLTSVSRILSVYRSSRSRDKICGYDEDDRNDEEDEESEFEGQTQLCSPFATTSTFSTRVNLPARSARPGPCDPVDAFYPGSLSAAFARQPRRHPLPRRPLLASCSMPELTDSVSAGRHTTISDILLSIWLKCMIRPFCACMRCPSSLSSSMKSSISETNTGNSFSVSPAEGSWCGNVFGARAISCCYCHFLRSLLSRSWNHATDSHSSINKAFLFGMTSSLFPGVVISSTASSHPLIPISCNTVAQLSIEPTELDRISRSRQSRVTCGRKKRSLRRTRSLLSVSMTKVRLDILTKMLDLTVFRSPAFCLFLASNGLLFFWYNVTFFFMSLRAEQQAGISDVLSAYLLSVLGVANMIGEVLVGCLADCEGVDTLLLYIICMLICGVSTTMVPMLTTFPSIATYAGKLTSVVLPVALIIKDIR